MPVQAKSDASILEYLYDVALDPTSYERLQQYWDEMIRPALQGEQPAVSVEQSISHLWGHLERADKVLGQAMVAPPDEGAQNAVNTIQHAATLALNASGRLVAVNLPATLALGVTSGARISDLPLQPGEAERLHDQAKVLLHSNSVASGVVCLRALGTDRLIVVHLRLFRPPSEEAYVLCVTSEVSWPAGFSAHMQQSFGLSATEVELLRHLTEGYSLRDISEMRARSMETVRVQVKSVLAKTGARSQLELVRIALSTIEVLHASDGPEADRFTLPQVPTESVTLPDGRMLEYLIFGDPAGRPVLFLPLDLGFSRWPPAAEAEARRRKLKIIVVVRPGYGRSSPLAAGQGYMDRLISDHLYVLDHLRVQKAQVLTLGDDSLYAFALYAAAPHRISGVFCCGGALPFRNVEQYERMGKWHRFILTAARYTPQFLPFIVKAGAAMARRLGKKTFLKTIYAVSEADAATFQLPEVSETLIQGSDIMLSETHSAHDALARELIAKATTDWEKPIEQLRFGAENRNLPVVFFNGEQDPQVPTDTLREFLEEYSWIDFRVYPDAGQLIFYLKWRDVLDVIETAR